VRFDVVEALLGVRNDLSQRKCPGAEQETDQKVKRRQFVDKKVGDKPSGRGGWIWTWIRVWTNLLV
jgi:hypothetical protein